MMGATTVAMVLAGVALVVAGGAVGFAVALYGKATRMAEPHRRFLESLGKMEFPEDLTQFLETLGTVHRRVEDNQRRVDEVIEALRGAITRVGLVRFDAFENMGGMMSFALALVDDRANGVVLTGIHSRNSFDTYCRRVVGGAPEVEVSAEEQQALGEALRGWSPR
jgi:hypothetical protein